MVGREHGRLACSSSRDDSRFVNGSKRPDAEFVLQDVAGWGCKCTVSEITTHACITGCSLFAQIVLPFCIIDIVAMYTHSVGQLVPSRSRCCGLVGRRPFPPTMRSGVDDI